MRCLSVLLVGLLISCSGSTNGTDDKCSDNADCLAGQVCDSAGACQVICNSDTQCASGEICEDDVCVVGTRSTAPEIAAIRGNGSTACVSGLTGRM